MAIHKLERSNLYERIADEIEQRILRQDDGGNWVPGEKLPSEQALADSFGVSRNVVREAIKVLKERGLVETKTGIGVYITKPDMQSLSGLLFRYAWMNGIDMDSIYAARLVLEKHAAESAAENCTDEELDKMAKLLEKMKQVQHDAKELRELDYMYHVAIAQAAGNPMLVTLIYALKDFYVSTINSNYFAPLGIENSYESHQEIMRALQSRNSEAAGLAIEKHLKLSMEQAKRIKKRNNE